MSKYITAEQVNNAVALCKDEPFSKASIFAITELLPSADVVEVVRCKDCKYLREENYCFNCNNRVVTVKPDDYCAWAERRKTE